MRQWHQGKEGFMKVTRIQDKYNPDKVWMIKRYLCGTFYVNQEIKARQQPQKRHTHQRDGAKKAAPPSIRLASL